MKIFKGNNRSIIILSIILILWELPVFSTELSLSFNWHPIQGDPNHQISNWGIVREWTWNEIQDADHYSIFFYDDQDPSEPIQGSGNEFTSSPEEWIVTNISWQSACDIEEHYCSGQRYYIIAYDDQDEVIAISGPSDPPDSRKNKYFHIGDPVDIFDGSLWIEQTDFSFPSPGGIIDFTRTYSTRRTQYKQYYDGEDKTAENSCNANRKLGKGWHHNWDIYLDFRAVRVFFIRPDGFADEYDIDGSTYIPSTTNHDVLEQYDAGGGTIKYKLTTLDKTVFWFGLKQSDKAYIEKIADSCGREILFTYSGGNLTKVTDTAGREYSIDYNNDYNIEHIFIEKGQDNPPSWDANDLTLASFSYKSTDEDILETATNAKSETTTYRYGGSVGWSYSYIVERENNDNDSAFYTYDEANEVYTQVVHGDQSSDNYMKYTFEYEPLAVLCVVGYDGPVRRVNVTDANNNTTSYYFYKSHGFQKVVYPDGTDVVSKYDEDGNVLEKIIHADIGESDYYLKTVNTYGDYGNLLTTVTRIVEDDETAIEDTDLSFSYDEGNFPSYVTQIEDALEHKTYFDYDNTTGNLLKTYNKDVSNNEVNKTEHTYYTSGVKKGLLQTITDGCGNETTYDYDAFGNLNKIDREILPDTTLTYDEDEYIGVPISITIPGESGNRQTTFTYDALNRVLSTTYPPSDGASDNFSVHYTYNADGKPLTETYKYNGVAYSTITNSYNEAGFLMSATAQPGTADEAITEYSYDDMGKVTQIEDPLGKKIIYEYDDNDHLNKITYYEDGDGDKYEEFTYYPDGSLSTRKDCAQTTFTYEYNDFNLLQYIKQGANTLVTYSYLDNQLIDTIQNTNGTIDYGYDIYNRLTSIDGPLTGTVDKVEYQYFENGMPSQLKYYVDANAVTVDYSYNALNQLTEADYDGEKTITYSYDSTTGKLTKRSLPNGTYTDYGYDDLGRVLSINNKRAANDVIDSFVYHYNNNGLRDKVTYQDGRYTDYGYDGLFRLQSEIQKTKSASTLFDFRHTVDKSGNRTALKYENDANKTLSFSYNALNQVTGYSGTKSSKVNVTGKVPSFHSISNVNITPNSQSQKSVIAEILGNFFVARNVELNDSDTNSIAATSSDTTKAGNSVSSASVTDVKFDATPSVSYQYDDNGNRISKTDGDDTTTYSYDFLNRLTEITYDDGSSTKFFYDALSRKFKEQELDASEQVVSEKRFVYDGFNVILELNSSNETVAEYVYGLNLGGGIGGILFKKDSDGHYFYYNYDGRGDVASISDESKSEVAQYEYSAYGNLLTKTGSFDNDFLYSTKPLHGKSGLYYFGYRWYDTATTCWLGRDPAHVLAGFNLYQNVSSNPLSFIDPYGLCQSEWEGYWQGFRRGLHIGGAGVVNGLALGIPSIFGFGSGFEGSERQQFMTSTYCGVGANAALFMAGTGWAIGVNPVLWGGAGGTAVGATATGTGIVTAGSNGVVDPNKLHHIFDKAGRGLEQLVNHFGSQQEAYRAVQDSITRHVQTYGINGRFESTIFVGEQLITVRGAIIDGIVKIGTFWPAK